MTTPRLIVLLFVLFLLPNLLKAKDLSSISDVIENVQKTLVSRLNDTVPVWLVLFLILIFFILGLLVRPSFPGNFSKKKLDVTVDDDKKSSSASPPAELQPINQHLELPASKLPPKPYRELVGRGARVDEIMNQLRNPNGNRVVGIDGMGGIGKTALAYEVAEAALSRAYFDVVVWQSALKQDFSSKEFKGLSRLTFDVVLDVIASNLNPTNASPLRGEKKKEEVKELLRKNRVLLALDNLETSDEPQNELAHRLMDFLGVSRALLTSRHRFSGDIYPIRLRGLEEDHAIRYIRLLAEEKNISSVAAAKSDELKEIISATGGSPLALKLVVGQLEKLPIESVLTQLNKVQIPKGDSEEYEYSYFYKFIFFPSWQLLSHDSKKLLVSMARFEPNYGGTYERIKDSSGLDDRILDRSIEELWRLSFLEIADSPSLRKKRYYLHPLTQNFVLSDIVKRKR